MSFEIRVDGNSRNQLLISCVGDTDTGGGLFSYDGSELSTIDRVATTGICATRTHLYRSFWTVDENSVGEIVVYDARGVERYHRVDELADPHDVLWDGSCLIVVSSLRNCIFWIATSGRIERTWIAPGQHDSWHLNGLYMHDGALKVCAFGRYRKHREWKPRLQEGDGIVFDFADGRDLLTGLCAPHTPRYFDGAWAICNSAKSELLHIGPECGRVLRRAELRWFTRGLAISDDFIFVGESAHRDYAAQGDLSAVTVLDRRTWKVLDRMNLPCREIYDIVVARSELVEGARVGFRTNPRRVMERDQLGLLDQVGADTRYLWPTPDRLAPADCRVSFAVEIPQCIPAGETVVLDCRLTNRANSFLASIQPYPVHVSYKWFQSETEAQLAVEGLRTALPRGVLPLGSDALKMRVQAPDDPGDYILRITLVQEHVAWFDDIDPANSLSGTVRVEREPPAE
jgi:acetolactate synthase I/II/III large subunit